MKVSCYHDSFVLPVFSALTPQNWLAIIAVPSKKPQLNNPLCFVHSSTAGHAACWQYSKPDKNLVKRIRPIELGHDKQQPRAVAVMSFFVFLGAEQKNAPAMHQNSIFAAYLVKGNFFRDACTKTAFSRPCIWEVHKSRDPAAYLVRVHSSRV